MKFNVNKCKVLPILSSIHYVQYLINDRQFSLMNKEKDLWILIISDLKPSEHHSEVVNTAGKLTGFIRCTFESKLESFIICCCDLLSNAYSFSPHITKYSKELERVQFKVTKMIPQLRNIPCEEWLHKLNLFSLTKRRM